MYRTITWSQLRELEDVAIEGVQAFHKALEEYTGIEARPYTAYQYFDAAGNYVGDSNDSDLQSILAAAYVEVIDDE